MSEFSEISKTRKSDDFWSCTHYFVKYEIRGGRRGFSSFTSTANWVSLKLKYPQLALTLTTTRLRIYQRTLQLRVFTVENQGSVDEKGIYAQNPSIRSKTVQLERNHFPETLPRQTEPGLDHLVDLVGGAWIIPRKRELEITPPNKTSIKNLLHPIVAQIHLCHKLAGIAGQLSRSSFIKSPRIFTFTRLRLYVNKTIKEALGVRRKEPRLCVGEIVSPGNRSHAHNDKVRRFLIL